jgi:1-aminocyclopropane-1-carboxylate deaminase
MISPITPSAITIDDITHLSDGSVSIAVLRLDKIHPQISGNKWFKLRYYLEEATALNKKNIVTFGGAWSNHLLAVASATQLNGLGSTGIIRGEEPPELSSTLTEAKKLGMKLIFISREGYREKQVPAGILSTDDYLVPEGGYGAPGAKGAATILDHCGNDFTHYCCAVGTGTMMAGLINGASLQCCGDTPPQYCEGKRVIGVSVLKNNPELSLMIEALVADKDTDNPVKWQLITDNHFGGYAKYNPELLAFMNDFYQQTGIPSDFVYTGKLFFAVTRLLRENYFPKGSKILVIHSGGLQGNISLRKGLLIF